VSIDTTILFGLSENNIVLLDTSLNSSHIVTGAASFICSRSKRYEALKLAAASTQTIPLEIIPTSDSELERTVSKLSNQARELNNQAKIERLKVLVPKELFINDNGTVDQAALNTEIQTLIGMGYPDNNLTDEALIKNYSGMLHTLDQQRMIAKQVNSSPPSYRNISNFTTPQAQALAAEKVLMGTPEARGSDGQHYYHMHGHTAYRPKEFY
jgi:hypothetical protein